MAFYEWSEGFEVGIDGDPIAPGSFTILTSTHAHTGMLSATQALYALGNPQFIQYTYEFIPATVPPDGPNDSECEAWFYTDAGFYEWSGTDQEVWSFSVHHGAPDIIPFLRVTFYARRRGDTGDLVVRVVNDLDDELAAEVTIPADTWIGAHLSINTAGTLYRATVTDDLGTVYIDASGPVWIDPVPPFYGLLAGDRNDGNDHRVYLDDLSVVIPDSLLHFVRQYPRDDGLGLSSAPRIFPPPKARRVVGGYQ